MIGMIQPLKRGLPPLRLFAFGTNNKFTAADVKNRLFHVKELLESVGIELLTYSTDGDSREMKVMRELSQLGGKHNQPPVPRPRGSSVDKNSWEYLVLDVRRRLPHFVCDLLRNVIPVQDTVHLGAKLRVRLLKTLLFLAVGDKIATPAHITSMQDLYSKDQHNLREGDLSLIDKMNYDAVNRLSKPVVRSLLESVPGKILIHN